MLRTPWIHQIGISVAYAATASETFDSLSIPATGYNVVATRFVPSSNTTLSDVWFRLMGSVDFDMLQAWLMSDSGGLPASVIESKSSYSWIDSSIPGGVSVRYSGWTTPLTAGTSYWVGFVYWSATPISLHNGWPLIAMYNPGIFTYLTNDSFSGTSRALGTNIVARTADGNVTRPFIISHTLSYLGTHQDFKIRYSPQKRTECSWIVAPVPEKVGSISSLPTWEVHEVGGGLLAQTVDYPRVFPAFSVGMWPLNSVVTFEPGVSYDIYWKAAGSDSGNHYRILYLEYLPDTDDAALFKAYVGANRVYRCVTTFLLASDGELSSVTSQGIVTPVWRAVEHL